MPERRTFLRAIPPAAIAVKNSDRECRKRSGERARPIGLADKAPAGGNLVGLRRRTSRSDHDCDIGPSFMDDMRELVAVHRSGHFDVGEKTSNIVAMSQNADCVIRI